MMRTVSGNRARPLIALPVERADAKADVAVRRLRKRTLSE